MFRLGRPSPAGLLTAAAANGKILPNPAPEKGGGTGGNEGHMRLFEGKFWRCMGRLAEVFLVNALWLLGCLPVVTAGASTAAMLRVFLRMFTVREEPPLRSFRTGFVSSFKQATAVWAVYLIALFDIALVLWTGYRLDRLADWGENRVLLGLGLFLGVLLLFTVHYIFGVIAYFDCSFQQCFVNALGLSFRHLGWTVLLVLLSAATVLLVYVAPFLALIAFGLTGLADSRILLHIFRKYAEPAGEA